MDYVNWRDENKHNHHVEAQTQVTILSQLLRKFQTQQNAKKRKGIEIKQASTLIDSLFKMHTSIECEIFFWGKMKKAYW
jgi:hypothetical protein